MSEIKGKKILIVGFGREGKSVFSYLRKNCRGIEISVADRNHNAVKYLQHLETFSGEDYLSKIGKFDTVIKSPGIPPSGLFRKARHLTTPTNIFFEKCKGTVIGVTGTKGKSTTSTFIAHILAFGRAKKMRSRTYQPDIRLIGNVGKPALDYLDGATERTVFVMELSSYQLMDIRYSPRVAVLLPIYEEHLNYHGGFANYVKAKANITKFQTPDDFLYYYEANKYCREIAKKSCATKVPFKKFVGDTPLLGEANRINSGAAIAVATHFVIKGKIILNAINSFAPLPHRLESVGKYKGIEFINDSLATIPEATMHALEAFGERAQTLIAGGFDRGVSFTRLGKELSKSFVKTLILFPDTGEKIEAALKSADPKSKIRIFKTDEMTEAVRLAYKHTPKGAVCLMSPASTSFNLFKDYEERGNKFKEAVRQLAK